MKTDRGYLKVFFGVLVGLLFLASTVQAQNPFSVQAELLRSDGEQQLAVTFQVPAGHVLYADSIAFKAPDGVELTQLSAPEPVQRHDEFNDTVLGMFTNDTRFLFLVSGTLPAVWPLTVTYEGCSAEVCFLPFTAEINIKANEVSSVAQSRPAAEVADASPGELLEGFQIVARETGYLNTAAFIKFLDSAEAGTGVAENKLQTMFARSALWAWLAMLLIVLGGLSLNLTPCVLPLIPVNIAILGAGARSSSRARGFALGATYGIGMALAYGAVGAVVVLTGARFGSLNASPIFNLVIAVIFLFLALAMFDVFYLDFSRFSSGRTGSGDGKPKSAFLLALGMGAITALLAGSCVAPILISVLLLAADLYQRGQTLGVALPFLLGVGMALPWPFLGAGLSVLPAPGRWMARVKYVFGILILLLAIYYGYLGVRLFVKQYQPEAAKVETVQPDSDGWRHDLHGALQDAREQKRPVLVDFWASWCKSCLAMEDTTFRQARVLARLEPYIRVKYQAEQLTDAAVVAVMKEFDVIGLPTYVILNPLQKTTTVPAPAVQPEN